MIGWGFPASCVPVDKQVDRGTDDDVEQAEAHDQSCRGRQPHARRHRRDEEQHKRGHHHQHCDADRLPHTGGNASKIPDSQRDRNHPRRLNPACETAEMRSDRIGEIISLAADIFTPSDEGERERSRQRSSRPTDGPHSVVDYSSWPAPPKRGMSCGPHDTGQGTSLMSDHQAVGYPAPPSGGRLPGGASGRSPGRRPPQPLP